MSQCYRTERPESKPAVYGQTIFSEGTKDYLGAGENHLSTNGTVTTACPHASINFNS